MPKFPNIPRLTIVVPHTGENESFENSLVSVLQHRPSDCEVLVPHAGDYDDPFELGDEVQFVDAGSRSVVRQVAEAAGRARGRFVHVVAGGHTVTPSWTDKALAEFEFNDAGVVIPVVRMMDGTSSIDRSEVHHAGWRRSASTACELIGAGATDVEPRQCMKVDGGFLSTSFWRRDLLRSLTGTYLGDDVVEASLVYSLLAGRARWRCVVSRQSNLVSPDLDSCTDADYELRINANQRRLQAISDHFGSGGGWGKSVGRFMATCFSTGVGAAIARATAPLASNLISQQIRPAGVLRSDEQAETLRIPGAEVTELRRAA